MKDIFRGRLVRLAADPPEVAAKSFARWGRDSEYHRLADGDPARLWSEQKHRERIGKQLEEDGREAWHFSIRTLAEDVLIGELGIRATWEHADAWVGIAIGERQYWSRGYGSDAMRLILGFGFYELGLQRISLSLHSYNARARRVYEKLGFAYEGIVRGDTLKEGRRTDGIYMGILRREWLALEERAS